MKVQRLQMVLVVVMQFEKAHQPAALHFIQIRNNQAKLKKDNKENSCSNSNNNNKIMKIET